jgi:hypothetical protein
LELHDDCDVSALWPYATMNAVDPSNPHRRAEARSLALHREVAERIRERPELLEPIRARVNGWLRDGTVAKPYAEAWWELLSRELEALLVAIVDPSERGRDLRQCTPFAGILDPRTRWRILRETSEDSRS